MNSNSETLFPNCWSDKGINQLKDIINKSISVWHEELENQCSMILYSNITKLVKYTTIMKHTS